MNRPDRRKRLIFALVTVAGIVVLLEFVLHALAVLSPSVDVALATPERPPATAPAAAVPDDLLEFRPNPAHPGHDARGFRNPPGVRRAEIVALGDSQTYGAGVDDDEAWPRQLERMTGRTTYSMAFGGYGPTHGLALLDEALSLEPEVVIEAFYAGNDLWDCYHMVHERGRLGRIEPASDEVAREIEQAEERDPLAPRIATLFRAYCGEFDAVPRASATREALSRHSRIYAVGRALQRSLGGAPAAVGSGDWADLERLAVASGGLWEPFDSSGLRTVFVPRYRLLALDRDDVRIREGHRIAMSAISLMAERVRSRGGRFVVLLLPTKLLAFSGAVESGEPSADYRKLVRSEWEWREETKAWLEASHIDYVDALPALEDCVARGEQPYGITQDGHPNAPGHRAIARLVADHLAG